MEKVHFFGGCFMIHPASWIRQKSQVGLLQTGVLMGARVHAKLSGWNGMACWHKWPFHEGFLRVGFLESEFVGFYETLAVVSWHDLQQCVTLHPQSDSLPIAPEQVNMVTYSNINRPTRLSSYQHIPHWQWLSQLLSPHICQLPAVMTNPLQITSLG